MGEEGRPSDSLDTKEKDSRSPRARASMKEHSLSTLSSPVHRVSCCKFNLVSEVERGFPLESGQMWEQQALWGFCPVQAQVGPGLLSSPGPSQV